MKMTPKTKKTMKGTVVPTMMPPLAMNIGGSASNKKKKAMDLVVMIGVTPSKKKKKT